MADGSVIIDTKLDTSGLQKMDSDIEAQLKKLEKQLRSIANDLTKALDSVDASGMVNEIKGGFRDAETASEKSAENIENDLQGVEDTANTTGETVGDEIKDGFRDAESAGRKSVGNIESNLRDVGDTANASGEKVADEIKDGFQDAETSSKSSTRDIRSDLEAVGDKADDVGERISDELGEGFDDAEKKGKSGSDGIGKGLDGIGDAAGSTGNVIAEVLGGAFKKVLAVVSFAEIAGEVIEFGKQCLELGSDLEEVQNVVDVTFETMSDAVNDFAKDAKKSAGLSEKMAKQYVGTFGAMAKSFGFAETEAYEMSTALTQLSGDIASFYNISQDEAYTKLKSVFTGETEALKELGVVMTETALDAYAMANGFGKATSDMTEQEKVALRYQFVMSQLSAASGDFVRTQDSWANQCKILSLQWESLMATLGSGLIDALLPGIQFLNDTVLPALSEFAERFAEAFEPTPSEELASSLKDFEKSMKDANKQFETAQKEIEYTALKAANYKKRLEELETAGLNTAESQIAYATVVEQLNTLYPELNLKINEQTGLIDDNSRARLQNIETMKQQALYQAMQDRYNAALAAQAEAELALRDAQASRTIVETDLKTIQDSLIATTGMEIAELTDLYNALMMNGGALYDVNGNMNTLTASEIEQINQMFELETELNNLDAEIQESNEVISGYQGEIEKWDKAIADTIDGTVGQTAAQGDLIAATEETTTAVDTLISEYNAAKEAARQSIDSQIGCFDELVVESDLSTSEIIANWASQKKGFDEYSANLQKAIDMGLDEALVKQLSDGSAESMAILDEFVNDTDIDIDAINAAFKETEQSKETVSAVMADIQTDTSKKLEAISKEMKTEWGDMADTVRAAISKAQGHINSLTGKKVYNDIITRYSTQGNPSATSTTSTTAPATAASIPFLAKGTVIPPNAPFMAVLGDQRHGTNIEAPLSTIQEAVALVMEDQTAAILAGFQSSVGVQREILEAVLGIQIGDDVIGSAVSRYTRKQAVMRGGAL